MQRIILGLSMAYYLYDSLNGIDSAQMPMILKTKIFLTKVRFLPAMQRIIIDSLLTIYNSGSQTFWAADPFCC